MNIVYSFILRYLFLLLLYFLCRVVFLLFNLDYFITYSEGLSFASILKIFIGGTRFDLSALGYSNLLFTTLSLIPFAFREKAFYQKILLFVYIFFNYFPIASNLFDTVFFSFRGSRSSFATFSEFENEGNVPSIIFSNMIEYAYLTIFLILTVPALIYIFKLTTPNKKNTSKSTSFNDKASVSSYSSLFSSGYRYYIFHTLIFFTVFILIIGSIRGGFSSTTFPLTVNDAGAYITAPGQEAIVLNTPFSVIRTLKRTACPKLEYFSQEKLKEIYSPEHIYTEKSGNNNENKHRVVDSFPSKKKRNIVIIILESFSAEYSAIYNKDIPDFKSYTPFLDSLSLQSLVFKHTIASGRISIDAIPSICLSIPSLYKEFVLSIYSNNKTNGLITTLKPFGYKSNFFHGGSNGTMGFSSITNQIGIENYYGMNEFKTHYGSSYKFDSNIWGIHDKDFLIYSSDILKRDTTTSISTIFTLSSHEPFTIPREYQEQFPEGPLKIHKCINYTDYALKLFFENIKSAPWYNDALFVIVADHGSGSFYKAKYNNFHGRASIPLIFFTPDGSLKGLNDSIPASQLDVMPTIIDYLNLPTSYFAFGKSLLKTSINSGIAINHYDNIFNIYYKEYLLLFDEKEPRFLYKYQTDYALTNDILDSLSNSNPKLLEDITNKAKAFIQVHNSRMRDNTLTLKD